MLIRNNLNKVRIGMSTIGIIRTESYMERYCETSNSIRALARFLYCHRNRLPAHQNKILNILLDNARICLDHSFLSEADRHIRRSREIMEGLEG